MCSNVKIITTRETYDLLEWLGDVGGFQGIIYFCFLFTDGLYYYELKDFKEEWVKTNGRLDRGRPEFKPHYNIPITELVKIEYEELKELEDLEELEGYDEIANSFCNIKVK